MSATHSMPRNALAPAKTGNLQTHHSQKQMPCATRNSPENCDFFVITWRAIVLTSLNCIMSDVIMLPNLIFMLNFFNTFVHGFLFS